MHLLIDLSWAARYYSDATALDKVIGWLHRDHGITSVSGVEPGPLVGQLRRRIEPEWGASAPTGDHAMAIGAMAEDVLIANGCPVYTVGGGDIVDGLAAAELANTAIMSGRKRARLIDRPRFDGREFHAGADSIDELTLAVEAITSKVAPGIPGLGVARARSIFEHFGVPDAAWRALTTKATSIESVPGVPDKILIEIIARLPRIVRWVELYRPWPEVGLRRVG